MSRCILLFLENYRFNNLGQERQYFSLIELTEIMIFDEIGNTQS